MIIEPILSTEIWNLIKENVSKMAKNIWEEISHLKDFSLPQSKLVFLKLPDQSPYLTFYYDCNELMRVSLGIETFENPQKVVVVDIAIKGNHLV